jgi:Flp pilus assembly pilin Flp
MKEFFFKLWYSYHYMMNFIFKNIVRNAQGSTAVEYAMVLPILLLFIMGSLEYDLVMYGMTVLEGATTTAAREGKTGYTASGMSQQQYIYGVVQTRVSGLMNPANLTISSKSYANFAAIGQPEPCISPTLPPCPGTPGVNFVDVNHNGTWDQDQGAAGLGGAGDIVVYTVTYPWQIITPFLKNVIGTSGVFTLTSSAVVKNEPYSGSTR